jgi:hypothetical protein
VPELFPPQIIAIPPSVEELRTQEVEMFDAVEDDYTLPYSIQSNHVKLVNGYQNVKKPVYGP